MIVPVTAAHQGKRMRIRMKDEENELWQRLFPLLLSP
jgi:hypothetical protein